MNSRYSKGPRLVSHFDKDLAIIDSYDKEMQRINTDYATAEKQIKDFRSKVDISSLPRKEYFDKKYQEAVNSFASGVDLTKRGQVYKVQSALDGVIQDPIVSGAIQSTAAIKKLTTLREELKTNPKYKGMYRAADEAYDMQRIQDYHTNPDLKATFGSSNPTVTPDVDKLLEDKFKKTPMEEASHAFGAVDTFEKYRSMGKNTNISLEVLTNPEAQRAMQMDFNYNYGTPEKVKAYGEYLREKGKQIYSRINSDLVDISAKIKTSNDPAEITKLNRQASNLQEQQQLLKSVDPNDKEKVFQAYVLNKAYDTSEAHLENSAVKTEFNKTRQYFDKRKDVEDDKNFKERKFNYEQQQDAIVNEQRERKLESEGASKTGTPGIVGGENNIVEGSVTFQEVKDITSDVQKKKIALKDANIRNGSALIKIFHSDPNTPLGKKFAEYEKNNKLKITEGTVFFSPAHVQQFSTILHNLIKSSGNKVTPDILKAMDLVEEISKNTLEYNTLDTIQKKAAKDSGYTDRLVEGGAMSQFEESAWNVFGVKSEAKDTFEKLLKEYTQKELAYKSVLLPTMNKDNEPKKGINSSDRAKVAQYLSTNGLINSKGERFGTSTTMGVKSGSFGNNTLSGEFLASIDWDNAVVAIEPNKTGSRIKINLKAHKDGEVVKSKDFSDGVAYIDVPDSFANDLTYKYAGKSLSDFREEGSTYGKLNTYGFSKQQKNKILDTGLLSARVVRVGNTTGNMEVRALDDNNYEYKFVYAGKTYRGTSVNPEKEKSAIEKASLEVAQLLQSKNNYTDKNFKEGVDYVINQIVR